MSGSHLEMKVAAVALCVVASWAPRVSAWQDVGLSVDTVVGCYELQSIEWTPRPALPESAQRLYTPPRFFALTATQTSGPYRRLLSRYPQDPQRLANGEWMLSNERELTAMFPRNGFERLFLIVGRQSGSGRFEGRAVVHTDTGSRPEVGKVVFDRVTCWEIQR